MSESARRGDIWSTDAEILVLVISSTVYNEIPSEPTVIVVPVFEREPGAGFGIRLSDDGWAAPGLVTNLRKTRLRERRGGIGVQGLTEVNNMLFKILATPDR